MLLKNIMILGISSLLTFGMVSNSYAYHNWQTRHVHVHCYGGVCHKHVNNWSKHCRGGVCHVHRTHFNYNWRR